MLSAFNIYIYFFEGLKCLFASPVAPPPCSRRRRSRRFLMQAALDIPMTVYGTGGQTRGFIHVTDTAKCLEAAVVNPPAANGPVEIFNQVSKRKMCQVRVERVIVGRL